MLVGVFEYIYLFGRMWANSRETLLRLFHVGLFERRFSLARFHDDFFSF